MIVIPQMQEQRFNAHRIKELNAGLLLDADPLLKEEALRLRATFLSSDNNKRVAKKMEDVVNKPTGPLFG